MQLRRKESEAAVKVLSDVPAGEKHHQLGEGLE